MEIIIYLIVFFISTLILVKSADTLVESAEKIGLKIKLPYFFVGSVLIGFGTSLPALATSIFSVFKGFYSISVSNVVGSNITNILLIVGIPAFMFSIKIKKNIIKSELPFLLLSSLLPVLFFLNKKITLFEGLIFIISFISYIVYIYNEGKNSKFDQEVNCKCLIEIIKFVVSLIFLSISSKYTVESLIKISELLQIGVEVLTAILLALGTSLPELVTSFTILIKKKDQDMIVGNIIGSNVINMFLILGLSSLIAKEIKVNEVLLNLSVFLFFITLLFSFIILDKKVEKEEGFIFVILYLFYLVYLLFPNLT